MPTMEEYYLLYYEWKCVELPEDPGYNSRPTDILEDLIYCVSVGDLVATTVQAIAEKYEINHHVENGVWKEFHGFVPYDWVGEEPDEGFFAPFYEMRSRQSLTESLAAACDAAMRRFEEDKDSPLGAEFRRMDRNVRLDAGNDSGKVGAAPQPAMSTETALIVSEPTSHTPTLDDFRNYFYERLEGGSSTLNSVEFNIVLDPKKPYYSARVFVYLLFTHQNIPTLIHHNREYMQWEGNAYRNIEAVEVKKKLMLFLAQAKIREQKKVKGKDENESFVYEEFPVTQSNIQAIEGLLPILFFQSGKDIPNWIKTPNVVPSKFMCEYDRAFPGKVGLYFEQFQTGCIAGVKPASATDPSLLIFGKTQILNLASMETLPPSPHWFNQAALDYDYDQNAECPQWEKFLDSILDKDEESKATIMEFMGLCFTTITKFQKALYIKGPRRSGKGTIARITGAIIGEHNVAPQYVSDFANDFGMETFIGKTLVAVSDARTGNKGVSAKSTEKLLAIIGEDMTKINQKFKIALNLRLRCKFLFLSNLILKFSDKSGVMPSRFIFVKLTKSFYKREDEELEKKLRTELPGILNSAIRHLQALLARKKFIQPKDGEVLYKRMAGLCNPVSEFVQELEPYTYPDIIWEQWNEFCKEDKTSPGKREELWQNLEAAGYDCDFDVPRILEKIRELCREVTPTELRDCARKFKNSEVLDQKLQDMVDCRRGCRRKRSRCYHASRYCDQSRRRKESCRSIGSRR
jgi:P4 family phage/plasmid primase-like protien